MKDDFDLSKVIEPKEEDKDIQVQGNVQIQAGPVEMRSVPITQPQAKALVEAQKGRIMEFDHQAQALLEDAKALIVKDQKSNEEAVRIGALANRTVKQIDTRVKEIVDPANAFVKDIRNFGKALTTKLDEAKRIAGQKTANWRALVEMERLKAQELADRARIEVQKVLDAEGKKIGVPAPQIEQPVVRAEKEITRTEFGSAYFKTKKKFKVVNPMILERQYLEPNLKAIQEAVSQGVVPAGVEVWEETDAVFRR